jgi:HK97 family phage prohead protease/HK97 family phage major capsid protein
MKKTDKVIFFDTDLTFKKADPENDNSPLIIEGEASTNDIDRMRDIIDPKAWRKKGALNAYRNNPIILAFHHHDRPIGKATEIRATDNGLSIKAKISKAATEVYQLIEEGILKAFSVGFIAKDMDYDSDDDIFQIKDVELVEVSVVSVPANPYATFRISKNFNNSKEFEDFKKSFIEDDNDKPIEEKNVMGDETKVTVPAIDLEALKQELSADVMSSVKAALQSQKAEEEAERKAKEAHDLEVKTAAERLLEDAKSDIKKAVEEETALTLKEVTDKYAADLEEKKAEIEELRAAQNSRMRYSQNTTEDGVTEQEREAAVMIAKLFNKPIDKTNYFKTLVQKSGREHWATGTLEGWEEEFTTRVHNEMRESLVVEPVFSSIPMNTPTMHIPVNPEAGYGEWISDNSFRSSQSTANEAPGSDSAGDALSSTGDAVDHQLEENTITAYKLVTKEYIGYEEEEDSIVALMPMVRDAMARRMAKSADRAILRGDGTRAGTGLITGLTGLGASVTDVTFNSNSPTETVASVAYNDFLTARQNLGQYGDDPSSLVWIVSPALYYHLLGTSFQDQFLTMDKIGDRATLLDGQIGSIAGTPVLMSRHFDNSAIDSGTAGTAFAVLCRPTNFVMGQLRSTLVESDQDVFNQKRGFVVSRRFGFADLDVGYRVCKFTFTSN